MRMRVRSLASLSGLGIQRCHELWCRSQMWWLGSRVAVAVAAVASIQPLAWELPYAVGVVLKSKKKKKRRSCLEMAKINGPLVLISPEWGQVLG